MFYNMFTNSLLIGTPYRNGNILYNEYIPNMYHTPIGSCIYQKSYSMANSSRTVYWDDIKTNFELSVKGIENLTVKGHDFSIDKGTVELQSLSLVIDMDELVTVPLEIKDKFDTPIDNIYLVLDSGVTLNRYTQTLLDSAKTVYFILTEDILELLKDINFSEYKSFPFNKFDSSIRFIIKVEDSKTFISNNKETINNWIEFSLSSPYLIKSIPITNSIDNNKSFAFIYSDKDKFEFKDMVKIDNMIKSLKHLGGEVHE